MSDPHRPHVVVLGGGFGGLAAARELRRSPVRVTLVDKSNHHLFQPLLYQVATAALSAPDIAAPLRKLLRDQSNARVLMQEACSIDPVARRVVLDSDVVDYDYLVLATGMVHNYFGNDHWEAHAPGLKCLREAIGIRARVLRAYEAAERETDPQRRRALLTFVVIGAGPTGVEMAGALAEIATRTLADDYRSFDARQDVEVHLVEGADRVLPVMSPESSAAALESLRELGVQVHLGALASEVDDRGVTLRDGTRIQAETVVWAAGLKASPLTADLGTELDRGGRVKVTPDLRVPEHPEIFVIGDLMYLEQGGEPLPGVAQTAMQGGRFVGRQLDLEVRGEPLAERFVYRDKGSMATIGRARAVAEVGRSRFSGLFAWLLWMLVHVLFLVEFRNRIAVLLDWAYAYLTFQRSARVIIDSPSRPQPRSDEEAMLDGIVEAPYERAASGE